jgi:hypothetical protein
MIVVIEHCNSRGCRNGAECVQMVWKSPGEQQPGEVLHFEPHELEPGHAVAVDCLHVREKLFGGNFPAPYITGFLILQRLLHEP